MYTGRFAGIASLSRLLFRPLDSSFRPASVPGPGPRVPGSPGARVPGSRAGQALKGPLSNGALVHQEGHHLHLKDCMLGR